MRTTTTPPEEVGASVRGPAGQGMMPLAATRQEWVVRDLGAGHPMHPCTPCTSAAVHQRDDHSGPTYRKESGRAHCSTLRCTQRGIVINVDKRPWAVGTAGLPR